jgi:hypothetical protein
MKRLLVIFGLFACLSAHAQLNLVLDGSFEDTTINWQVEYGQGALKQWQSLANSYYAKNWGLMHLARSSASDTVNLKLPTAWWGSQYPKYGSGAIRFGTFYKVPGFYYSSHTKGKLSLELTKGENYCATAYVVCTERYRDPVTNGFSMYFDTGELDTMITIHHDSTSNYTFVQPQVQCPFLISDTINWTKVQGSFVANGTETHVNLSNFLSDSATLKDFEIDGHIYGVQNI